MRSQGRGRRGGTGAPRAGRGHQLLEALRELGVQSPRLAPGQQRRWQHEAPPERLRRRVRRRRHRRERQRLPVAVQRTACSTAEVRGGLERRGRPRRREDKAAAAVDLAMVPVVCRACRA